MPASRTLATSSPSVTFHPLSQFFLRLRAHLVLRELPPRSAPVSRLESKRPAPGLPVMDEGVAERSAAVRELELQRVAPDRPAAWGTEEAAPKLSSQCTITRPGTVSAPTKTRASYCDGRWTSVMCNSMYRPPSTRHTASV